MINYAKINAFEEGQRSSFEELVCQLARHEEFPDGSIYRRVDGAGGDGGVEAYWEKPNGRKTGYQAKFFLRSRDIDWGQIDESVNQALRCHPELELYIVALPCDLTDRTGAKGKGGTGWERWKDRVEKWKAKAVEAGISGIEFAVWTSSEISNRLIQSDAAGLREYFFGEVQLGLDRFASLLDESIASLDERFHPEDHVDVRTEKLFPVMSRSPTIKEELLIALDAVKPWPQPHKVPESLVSGDFRKAIDGLNESVNELGAVKELINVDPQRHWDVGLWQELAIKVQDKVRVLQEMYLAAEHSLSDASSAEKYELRGLTEKTWKLNDALMSLMKLLGSRFMVAEKSAFALINGSAGSGKSHLLAKCAEDAIEQGRPAVMILGQHLNSDELWSQIAKILGLPDRSADEILGALDAAGKRAGVRTLLLIDAINEGVGSKYWRESLPRLIKKVQGYSHVALVISCRAEYFELALPESIRSNYPIFKVKGFETHEEQSNAARVYLDKRGIARPSTPWLSPEFVNPLFLRSICTALEHEGKSELPPGLTGTKSMLSFYLKGIGSAIAHKEESTSSYAPKLGRAVLEIAGKMVERRCDFLDLDTCRDIVSRHFQNVQPRTEPDWLSVFINNGVLRKDPNPIIDAFVDEEVVRFSFQRFQDFLMAEKLLEGVTDPSGLFEESGALCFCLEDGRLAWQWVGLIDALTTLFPEVLRTELIDVLPGNFSDWWSNWGVQEAFVSSIKWRDRRAFSERTLQLLNKLPSQDSLDLLLEVAVALDHPYNAELLHRNLARLNLPDRDAFWTSSINSQDEEGSNVFVLIEWCLWGQTERTSAENQYLASLVLCWLFTSSNRVIRDKATKALANVLISSSDIFPKLLEKFEGVDDRYVLERLIAAGYSACCLDPAPSRLEDYSERVFEIIFKDGSPPYGILLRDYALGIIELADYHSSLPTAVDLPLCKPPYKSPKIRLSVSEAQLAKVAKRAGGDEILESTTGFLGDFAKYEVEPRVREFLRFPVTKPAPLTGEQKIRKFVRDVIGADSAKSSAFDHLRNSTSPLSSGFCSIEMIMKGWEPTDKQLAEWDASVRRARQDLLDLLSTEEKKRFNKEAWPNLRPNRKESREYLGFDLAAAKRWIAKRAYSYGWTYRRFRTDRYVGSYSRERSLTERIGKKYQWLALDEFLSRVADNYWMTGEFRDQPRIYGGPLDLGYERDIDPTILAEHQSREQIGQRKAAWELGEDFDLPDVAEANLSLWPFERNPGDSLKQLPIRTDPEGVEWLVLNEYRSLSEKYPEGVVRDHGLRMEEFRFFSTVMVYRCDAAKSASLLEKRQFGSGLDWCCDSYIDTAYLGEAPWRESWNQEKWQCDSWRLDEVFRYAQLTVRYAWESHLDASMPEGWECHIPAPWLASELKLVSDKNESGVWRDESGEAVFISFLDERSLSISMLRMDSVEKVMGSECTFLSALIAERRAWPGGSNANATWRRVEGVCWQNERGLRDRHWVKDGQSGAVKTKLVRT